MSYILEALKKAQAERQLGSAPTIHAMPIHIGPVDQDGARRKPLWIAVSAAALVLAAALAVMAWRERAPGAPAPAPLTAAPAASPEKAAPGPAPVAATLAVAPKPLPAAAPPTAAPKTPAPVVAARAPEPRPVKKAAPAPAADDEPKVQALAELPAEIQRTVPKVAFGGYMYSANPADRLLLVDKVLRHEGEEVAPGLMLEKLLPKAAVMNYKGYRYRRPY
jgi:general secretion pathway protein B